MKLADLRKLSIRKQLQIRFRLRNGMECVITEHGVAKVPALKGVPEFNLEQELASISDFVLEPVKSQGQGQPRSIGRDELAAMLAPSSAAAASEHDDE